jgi:hypothetical protein
MASVALVLRDPGADVLVAAPALVRLRLGLVHSVAAPAFATVRRLGRRWRRMAATTLGRRGRLVENVGNMARGAFLVGATAERRRLLCVAAPARGVRPGSRVSVGAVTGRAIAMACGARPQHPARLAVALGRAGLVKGGPRVVGLVARKAVPVPAGRGPFQLGSMALEARIPVRRRLVGIVATNALAVCAFWERLQGGHLFLMLVALATDGGASDERMGLVACRAPSFVRALLEVQERQGRASGQVGSKHRWSGRT